MGYMAGIIGKNSCKPDKADLMKMLESIKHRGEINAKIINSTYYKIGYGRTQLEKDDHVASSLFGEFDECCIDGTIILPSENRIPKYSLKTFSSDAHKLFSMLAGSFAMLLLDKDNEQLYLCIDHYGIKSLFWAETESFIYFASEIKAINAAGFPIMPSPTGLVEYLYHGLPLADRTMQKGIRNLIPGTIMQIGLRDSSKKIHSYYTPEIHIRKETYQTLDKMSEKDLINELERLLLVSVFNQTRIGSCIATFLSGGVDSSLITALIMKSNSKILPCTVHVSEPEGISELQFARKAAEYIGTDLKIIEFNGKIFRENLVNTIFALETPLILENAVGLLYASSKIKSEGVDVVIDGEGADSLFGGSVNVYKWHLLRYILRKKLPLSGKLLEQLIVKAINLTGKIGVKSYIPEPDRAEGLHFLVGGGGFDYLSEMSYLRKLFDHVPDSVEKEIQTALLNEFYCYMRPCYQRLSQSTITNQVEVRLPFMDQHVVNFCVNLPIKYRIGGFGIKPITKYLLKKLAERYLPKSLLYRPKMGFNLPGGLYVGNLPESWFRNGYAVSEYNLPGRYVEEWYKKSIVNRDRFLYATVEIWGQMFILGRTMDEIKQEYLKANT